MATGAAALLVEKVILGEIPVVSGKATQEGVDETLKKQQKPPVNPNSLGCPLSKAQEK